MSTSTPDAASQRIFVPGLFRGQTAVITDGGSGMGLATATEHGRPGATGAICGRTPEKLEKASVLLTEAATEAAQARGDTIGEVILAQPCDIREPTQALFDSARQMPIKW